MAEGVQPHGRGASAGRPLPQERRGQDPRSPAQGRPDRSGDRHGPKPVLRHRTRRLRGCPRRNKPADRKNKVLVIDAQSLFEKARAELPRPEHGEQVVEWFQAFEDVEDRPRSSASTRSRTRWTLNISRYVLPPIGEDIPPLPEAVAAFKDALIEARSAEDHLRTVLTEGGWLND